MSRFAAYLIRFAVILGGYLLACLAAAAMLGILAFATGQTAPGDELGPYALPALIGMAPIIAIFVAYFAFLPAILIVALAEWFGWRSWLAYALGGGLVGVAVYVLQSATRGDTPASELLPIMAASGIVAGLAYWLMAGRSAGLWLERLTAR